jgi:PAS domain-containing protein
MAIALKEGRAIRNAEVVAERPDGTRAPVIPYPTPLRDSTGKIVGAVNIVVDVSERKQAETQQRILLNELNHRVKNHMQMLQILLEAGIRRARSPEAREVLEEASGRVLAMAAAQRVCTALPRLRSPRPCSSGQPYISRFCSFYNRFQIRVTLRCRGTT